MEQINGFKQHVFKPIKDFFFILSKDQSEANSDKGHMLSEKMTSGSSSSESLLHGLTLPVTRGITACSQTAPAKTFR